jgi:hypothetical protein
MLEHGKDIAIEGWKLLGDQFDVAEELSEFDEFETISDIEESKNLELLIIFIEEIREYIKVERLGTIDMFSYPSLLELIEDQNVEDWASEETINRIQSLKRAHANLFHQLNKEWNVD